LPVTLGSYPITPASDILHELARHKNFGVRTVQAEDEIAAAGMALGAAFAGHLAITTTSGPGVALKSETTSLAISMELPMVIVDIQRGGPSTGLPTKTEAADLNIALFGRHGEAPLPVIASYSPAQCFDAAIEACRIALKYRTPVILLSDGYLANGSEPWKLPAVEDLPDISVEFTTEFNHQDVDGNPEYWPYLRDPETLARPWAIPGTPGLMHRIGGLEKQDGSGNINYTPENHARMGELRAAKIAGIAKDYAPTVITGDTDADVCILGWGSTWAAIDAAVQRERREGHKLAWVHLTHLNPLPNDLGDILKAFRTVLIPELNFGQLARIIRAEYLIDAKSIPKVAGLPFTAREIQAYIKEVL
jgi:2-oxoglutarate/2-oxoacid ferredoxin oxidoreductase subunit alpha